MIAVIISALVLFSGGVEPIEEIKELVKKFNEEQKKKE